MSLKHFTDESFKKEVTESELPVLVDFWAEWCGPCKQIAPIVEELAKEYSGKIKIGKINVDDNPRIATRYGIMSIPTLIIFKNGKISDQAVGALTKVELKRLIEEHI